MAKRGLAYKVITVLNDFTRCQIHSSSYLTTELLHHERDLEVLTFDKMFEIEDLCLGELSSLLQMNSKL